MTPNITQQTTKSPPKEVAPPERVETNTDMEIDTPMTATDAAKWTKAKQNKWKIYVTNHVTYFCDTLTELGLKIDTYPHELPLVVTANLNEIDHLYHKKTSDCIKACNRSCNIFGSWGLLRAL